MFSHSISEEHIAAIPQKPTLLRRSKLAQELKIPWPTVKYYQQIGFLHVAAKTPNGQHLFNLEESQKIINQIKSLKKHRLTIDEIKNRIIIDKL